MMDNKIEIEILRKCGIDPFKEYSDEDLSKILAGKEKSWRRVSQDSQKSESERITLAGNCEIVNKFLAERDYYESARESAKNLFLTIFNEELKKYCVLRTDGQYSIAQNKIEEVADKIIKDLGWSVSYSSELVEIDLVLYKSKNVYRDARNIFNKLKRINPRYASVEDWLNELMGMEKLRVEGCRPLNQDCSYPDFKNAVDKIQDRFRKNAYKDMEARSNHSELLNLVSTCVSCNEQTFKSFKMYDGLRTVFDTVEQAYSRGMLNDLAGLLKGIKVKPGTGDVIPFIEDFFLDRGYAFDFYGLDGIVLSCGSCGAIYKDDGRITACSKCGNILFTKCPKCGARCSSDDEFCSKCGCRNVDLKKLVEDLYSRYKSALNSTSFDDASRYLEEIEKANPGYAELNKLKSSLEESKKRYGELHTKMDECCGKKAIIEAIRLCGILKDEYPGAIAIGRTLDDLKIIKSEVDSLLNLHTDEESKVNDYLVASQLCTDDPRITNFLRNHPPMPPRTVDVMVSNDSVKILVGGLPDLSYTTLTFVRKMNGPPHSPEDGETVFNGQQAVFIDRALSPGIEYYYSIFSIRGGVASSGVKSKSVMILPKAGSVSINHLPDCIFGEMTVPKEATGIRIVRSGEDQGYPVNVSIQEGRGRFKDTSVSAGETYTYSIIVQYGTHSSGVVSISHTLPHVPILDLSIKKRGKQFHASLFDSGPFDIIISDRMIPSRKNYLTIDETKQYPKPNLVSGDFVVPDGYQGFAYAVRDAGNYCVLSNPVPISSLNGVDGVEYQVNGNDCTLMFSPPAKATSINVRWSTEKMPSDSVDDRSESFSVPINNFKCGGNKIRLHVNGRNVYVEIKASYGENRISDGYCMTIPISKPILEYSIASKKKLFSKSQTALITFRKDWEASTLDGLIIGIGARVAPRAIDEADETLDVPELTFKDGRAEFSFEIEKERIPMIRIFKKTSRTDQDFALRKV